MGSRLPRLFFGARTGSLHFLSGGSIGRLSIECQQGDERLLARVILWAPAFPQDWLRPHGKIGLAVLSMQDLYLMFNSRDLVLKRYRRQIGDGAANALGYLGLPNTRCLLVSTCTFKECDATGIVGRRHKFELYLQSCYLRQKVRQYALWEEV